MDELARWLTACLDEDERIARAAGGLGWSRSEDPGDPAAIRDSKGERVVCDEGWPSEGQEVHIAEWDPARVLREIEARRRTLAQHKGAVERMDQAHRDGDVDAYQRASSMEAAFRAVLRNDAAVYRDRPGYREEWRP